MCFDTIPSSESSAAAGLVLSPAVASGETAPSPATSPAPSHVIFECILMLSSFALHPRGRRVDPGSALQPAARAMQGTEGATRCDRRCDDDATGDATGAARSI